ncbi:MAG: sulfite exporter TauE/SafE family protein [Syntrophobacterales bacterium]|nr:sulfite exporter TauE/SafE family protein [Syntrophobacterales bacterium]
MLEWIESLVLSSSLLSLVGAFGGGIIASFTPCTYPILPIVVSFLGYQSVKNRGRNTLRPALGYFLGLSLAYGLLGTIAVFSGKAFGFWAGKGWLYILVGNVCLVAGVVMLEWVKLPSFFNHSLSVSPNRSGAFLMGMTSAFVVGPCTTPILGTVISVAAASDNIFQSLLLVLSFSFGIGMPILLLSSFTRLITFLPKTGPWLVTIQKFCGLVMLVFGGYFFVKAGMLW